MKRHLRQQKKSRRPLDKFRQRQLRDQIIEQQSLAGVLIGSVFGAAVGTAAYLAIWALAVVPIVAFLVPGIVAGFVTKYTGKAFESRYRLVCGLVTFLMLWATAWYIDGNPLTIVLALPNAVIAAALARRKLSFEQEMAIFRYRMGIDDESCVGPR